MRSSTAARIVFFVIVSSIIGSALHSDAATAAFAKGVVVTENGQPLPDVTVYGSNGRCCPFVPEVVKTDKDGFFQLEQPVEVIHFFAEGFRPAALVVQAGGNDLRVILEEGTRSRWIVPVCSNGKTGQKMVGYGSVRFSIPKAAKVEEHHFDEGSSYSVHLPNHSMPVELSWGGIHGNPHDDDHWILKSAHFGERPINSAFLDILWAWTREVKPRTGHGGVLLCSFRT